MVDRNHRAANDEVSKLERLQYRQSIYCNIIITPKIARISTNNLQHIISLLQAKHIQKGGKEHEDGSAAIIKNEPLLTGEEDEPENNQVITQSATNTFRTVSEIPSHQI